MTFQAGKEAAAVGRVDAFRGKLLLLDEPTNNLDIASIEVLENALDDFEGTILSISHDRYFLDRIVSRICELEDGFLAEYPGNYSDYQAAKK